jgi:Fe-S cluster assembly ATP-binding protein
VTYNNIPKFWTFMYRVSPATYLVSGIMSTSVYGSDVTCAQNEILQMALLRPALGVLDETDSGLDIDALRIVADGIQKLHGEDDAVIMITHYQRMLNYITPDFVHVMIGGKIVKSGDKELALQLEEKGYEWLESYASVNGEGK